MFLYKRILLSLITFLLVMTAYGQSDCYISLNSNMFYWEDNSPASAANEAGAMADEQTSMGDPANGNGTNVGTEWFLPWDPSSVSYIDLGQEYDINAIYYFDASGQGQFTVKAGLPASSNPNIIDDDLIQYQQWKSVSNLNLTTRYLTFTKTSGKVAEIAICGSPAAGNPCETEIVTAISDLACNSLMDGTYSFDLTVNKGDDVSPGTHWTATIEGNNYNEPYGTTVSVGGLDAIGGTLSFNVVDQDNSACTAPVYVTRPNDCTDEPPGECQVPGTTDWANGGDVCEDIYRLGRVSIGTSGIGDEADNMLLVNGTIRAERVKVELCASGNWCDYVFDPNYELMPLCEVDAFIQKNQHLPNIPSEATMQANGTIDMGQMTVKQQEKIEELFLYLIEMEKNMGALQQRVQELESENNSLRQQSVRK